MDFWDDPVDVYRVSLRRNQKLYAVLSTAKERRSILELWAPGSNPIVGRAADPGRLAEAQGNGSVRRLGAEASVSGFYYLVVKSAPRRSGTYRLQLAKS